MPERRPFVIITAHISADKISKAQRAFAESNDRGRFISVDDFNDRLLELCDQLYRRIMQDAVTGDGHYRSDPKLKEAEVAAKYSVVILYADNAYRLGIAASDQLNKLIQLAIETTAYDPYGDQQRSLVDTIIYIYREAGCGEVSDVDVDSLWTLGLTGLETLFSTMNEVRKSPKEVAEIFDAAISGSNSFNL